MLKDHPALTLFQELLVASPSGREGQLAGIVAQKLAQMGYTPEQDGAGNVLVRLASRQPDVPLYCLAAHMDEIGMVVTAVEPDGSLRVTRSGGLMPWKIGEGPVEILGDGDSITGILSMGSTHGKGADQPQLTWEQVQIVTGLTPAQLLAAGIGPGATAVPTCERRGPVLLGDPADPLAAAWTFDDRMGVVALLRLLEQLKAENVQPVYPTLIAFTVSEELGGQGAKIVCRRERPHAFIAVDGCPIPPGTPLKLDGRPGIWQQDRLGVYDPSLRQALARAAKAAGTELQPAFIDAASDASMVYAAGLAERVACFGHVRENSHGYEVARLSVFDHVLHTLLAFVRTGS